MMALVMFRGVVSAQDTLLIRDKAQINKLAELSLSQFSSVLNAIAEIDPDNEGDLEDVRVLIDAVCTGNMALFSGPDAIIQDNIQNDFSGGRASDLKVRTYLNDVTLFYQRNPESPIAFTPIAFAEPRTTSSGVTLTKILYDAYWPGKNRITSKPYAKHRRVMYFIVTRTASRNWSVRIATDDFFDEALGFRPYEPGLPVPSQVIAPHDTGLRSAGLNSPSPASRSSTSRKVPAPEYERVIKNGRRAYDQGRFDAAIDSFRKAMNMDPTSIEPLAFINKAQEELMVSARLSHEEEIWKAKSSAQSQRQRYLTTGGATLFVFGVTTALLLMDRKRRRDRFERDAAHLETQALRSQMNPHFIFNALNSINAFVQKNDSDRASAYLSKFARLMRLVLENSRQAEVPLKDDLEALDLYLNLERARGGDKFDYAIHVDPAIDQEDVFVPPLVIQPFVENAIWHGMAGKEGKGNITLSVTRRGEELVMAIEDDGVGRNAPKPTNTGAPKKSSLATTITQARLDLVQKQKGKPAGFRIIDLSQGTRVEVSLPIGEAA